MKNYVILLAGGVGKRMQSEVPKQFIEVCDKPIIIHTIERFEYNDSIDGIVIVCVKEWIKQLDFMIKKYNLKKVLWIIEGGNCSHDSIKNGIFFLRDRIDKDDYVIIHDAVRPIVPKKLVDNVLQVAYKYGNASSSIACHPPIVYTEDYISGIKDVDREHVMLTASPQVYKYSLALECYELAEKDNKNDFTFTSSLLIYYGKRVYFADGSTCNIKITKKEDVSLFKALLQIPDEYLCS